jgi:hypothetical protein
MCSSHLTPPRRNVLEIARCVPVERAVISERKLRSMFGLCSVKTRKFGSHTCIDRPSNENMQQLVISLTEPQGAKNQ